ncbi:putative subgroup of the nitrilase superfamily [Peptoniphilus sp. ING2-D1G]|nr:putative subgroup of the nitrilase superfamily [Peptoniphilus sp. ING2-D1G]
MKISLIQCNLSMGGVDENYKLIEKKIKNACENKPDVVVLPELWDTSFFPENVKELADKNGQRAKSFLSEQSKKYNVNIVGGSVTNLVEDKLYNTSYVFNRDGNLISEYNKVHLFTPAGEHNYFEFGDKMATFELDGVKCGQIICYDIRFLEWVRMNALDDISILFVPAAWPEVRNLHWDVLNRARAIENQMFVVCVNSTGKAGEGKFGGHSAIIDPWGEYIVKPDDKEEIKTGEIDLSIIKDIRERINVFRDRRKDLYNLE